MRLTTVRTDRTGRAARSSTSSAGRLAGRGTVPVAAFAVMAVALGLAASAQPAAASGTAASADGTDAARETTVLGAEPDGGAAAAAVSRPVAVAVVEQPDGSLAVETHEAGSVASAALVADQLGKRSDVVAAEVDHRVWALVSPADDDVYRCQWALQSTTAACPDTYLGTYAVAKRAMRASTAWGMSTGSGATVAVVDTGVWGSHEDLNGQVLAGYDVFDSGKDGTFDGAGHGTHVAGIVAAADNDKGVVGLAPGAKILPVRVLDSSGSGTGSGVAEGIVWAVDHGADVINLSLGGTYKSSVQQAAVNYALKKGVLVVAAAGNAYDQGNPTMYPAAFPGVLAVGATTRAGGITYFSERKPYVGVVAPGDDIASTCLNSVYEPADGPCGFGLQGAQNANLYAWLSGTSMAAPFVSAAAALLLEKNPNLSPAALGAYLTGTAIPAGVAGRDSTYGFGHLNPNVALTRVVAGTPRETTLTIKSSASKVTANAKVTLTAVFSSNGWRLARRPVEFQRYSDGAWKAIATVNTSASGVATYRLTVGRNTKYRALAKATAGLARTGSPSTTVLVKAKVTVSGSSPSADKVTVTAAISPRAQVKASLQRKVDGAWKTISTMTTNSSGSVTFNKSAPSGTQYFRVVVAASSIAGSGISRTLTLSVK